MRSSGGTWQVCGGAALLQHDSCPACRWLQYRGHSTPRSIRTAPLPSLDSSAGGACQLALQESLSDADRVELTEACFLHRSRLALTAPAPDDSLPLSPAALLAQFQQRLPSVRGLPAGMGAERGNEGRGEEADMAVVSNSSALLGSGLGSAIDAHRCVVRFNHFSTDGYAADVGGETSVHVCAALVAAQANTAREPQMLERIRKHPLTIWLPPLVNLHEFHHHYIRMLLADGEDEQHSLGLTLAERLRICIVRPTVALSLWRHLNVLKSSRGSTGFFFLLLGLGFRGRLTTYGYEDDPRNASCPRGGAYFQQSHAQVKGLDFSYERRMVAQYAACGRICVISAFKAHAHDPLHEGEHDRGECTEEEDDDDMDAGDWSVW